MYFLVHLKVDKLHQIFLFSPRFVSGSGVIRIFVLGSPVLRVSVEFIAFWSMQDIIKVFCDLAEGRLGVSSLD